MAQEETTSDEPTVQEKTVLHENLYTSARAAGMGGALGAIADGMDAAYYNPAGIGGLHRGKKSSKKEFRFLGFPYTGVAVNQNSVALNGEFSNQTSTGNVPLTSLAVLEANAGKRQYARASMVPGVIYSRFMVASIYDFQVAAVPEAGGTGIIKTKQQVSSGVGVGFSATDPGGRLYIGAFAASLNRSITEGDFTFGDFVDPIQRKETLSQNKKKYSGVTSNVGLLWRISKKGNSSIGIVSRNSGGTVYSPADSSNDPIEIEENLVLSFSVAPRLGKWGYFAFVLEAEKLTDPETTIGKKIKSGMEFTLGSLFGSESAFGIRLGGNSAGASGGIHANVGLIGLQVASYAEDIGTDNKAIIDRRHVAIFSVNVAY